MELFYSKDIDQVSVRLDEVESQHCIKVLRHRVGDEICVIDGLGTLLHCRLTVAEVRCAEAEIISREQGFGSHPYHLTMAVCPTKNIDRYEWFVEKATEIGVDIIAPVIGDHSERKIIKSERLERILLSASKQSLKASIPKLKEVQSVKEFIQSLCDEPCIKLICYCSDEIEQRVLISDALTDELDLLKADSSQEFSQGNEQTKQKIAILIGPEGDFSKQEVEIALSQGWKAISLGNSRLRTETAAIVAATAVYLSK